jgi:hypothetical protein
MARKLLGSRGSKEYWMPQTEMAPPRDLPPTPQSKERALKILAKSIYKELRQTGYEPKDIVPLSTELLDLIMDELRPEGAKLPPA